MDTILDTELPHPTQEYFAKISTPGRGRGGRWWGTGNRKSRPKGGGGIMYAFCGICKRMCRCPRGHCRTTGYYRLRQLRNRTGEARRPIGASIWTPPQCANQRACLVRTYSGLEGLYRGSACSRKQIYRSMSFAQIREGAERLHPKTHRADVLCGMTTILRRQYRKTLHSTPDEVTRRCPGSRPCVCRPQGFRPV